MLWIKSLHLIFIIAWFSGLFYLPRIFVNLAQETTAAAIERLLGMARRLYRFTTMLAVPAILFGFYLYHAYDIGKGPGNIWMHVKLGIVMLVVIYHYACGILLKRFENGSHQRSHIWYRWFNELPLLLLLAIVILTIVKPF